MSYGYGRHGNTLAVTATLTFEGIAQRLPTSGIPPMCVACFSARILNGHKLLLHIDGISIMPCIAANMT
jgi:hypothetical protein